MGVFLSVSAINTDERGQEVHDIVFRMIGKRGHRRLPKSMAMRLSGENQVMISNEAPDWMLLIYPNGFNDGFSCTEILSEKLDCKAFNFEIYDGQFWWYNFFKSGDLLDIFWQHPTYFVGLHPDEKIDDEILKARKGNPELIAEEYFGLPMQVIEPYYVQFDDEEFANIKNENLKKYKKKLKTAKETFNFKANSDDKYPLSSPWVFTDFAAKFGLIYPTQIQTHSGLYFYALKPKE